MFLEYVNIGNPGTIKVAEPYKIGNKTADVMLEVLNLDRKEVVSIHAISNEEFTEVMRDMQSITFLTHSNVLFIWRLFSLMRCFFYIYIIHPSIYMYIYLL